MNKQPLSPHELLSIGADHAYCAEHLLKQDAEINSDDLKIIDTLLPVVTLMHVAFELSLKAALLLEQHQIGQYKYLSELVEQNEHLGLSKEDNQLLGTLSRQVAFRKGHHYALWGDRLAFQGFCEDLMQLYVRLQGLMPVELQKDYIEGK